jgi:hypothetical protein
MTDDEITEAQVAEANETDPDGLEPAEPEEEPDEELEEEPEQAPEEPEGYAETERRGKEWDRVAKYLAKNVGDIEGDDAIHKVECPVCRSQGTPGYLDPRVPAGPEIIGPVLAWFGMRSDSDYLKDNYSRECDECAGLGETLSGSKVSGRDKLVCFRCKGNGWIPVGDERGAGLGQFTNGPSSVAAAGDTILAPSYMPDGTEPPEVASLRERGFVVIAPIAGPS